MCGIAGFVTRQDAGASPTDESRAVLDRMCQIIKHRGPDDQGMFAHGAASLGMRRLSIIDLAGGHQPIANETGNLHIVFNGEIYNYQNLRRDLIARGHKFQTHSDTETILHLYEEHGAQAIERLRGMFAFAIWNEEKRELFIARDRAGKKPLYYTLTPEGTLVFGSELKSLLQHPEVEARTNPEAVDLYLSFGYVPDPLSIFDGVHKLPPGCTLTFCEGRVKIEEYWDFGYTAEDRTPEEAMRAQTEDDYVAEINRLLEEAVRVRLISEVPLGAFLSGGVDSSTVVGLMARQSTQPVKTFSIGFNEDSYDELKYARIAAKHFNTDHHEFVVTPDICEIVDTLAWHFDEPFADSSAIPTYMVSKLAREHVTVALSGDGGDELFAGYTRYAVHEQRNGFARLPHSLRAGVMLPLSRRLPHGAPGRNYLRNVALDQIERYTDSVSIFTALNKESLYAGDFRRELGRRSGSGDRTLDLMNSYAARVRTGDPVDTLLYLDSKTYLPGDILTKVDRMSMAVSLEARTPLLDHKLIDFVARIPSRLKLKDGVTKHIMKRAVEGLVPAEILHRRKMGFGVPIDEWINAQLRNRIRETLTEQRTRERGCTDPRYVNLLLDEHARGRRNHSAQLWALFMLELWHRAFVDQTPAAPHNIAPPVELSTPVSV